MDADVPAAPVAVARIAAVDAAIQRDLGALVERLAELTARCTGDAAASYSSLRRRLLGDASAVHRGLVEMAASLPIESTTEKALGGSGRTRASA